MNWTVVPRITGGLGCMLVLVLGIATGVDPVLCTLRGLVGGMVGWVAGALWAYLMSQLTPTELPATEASPPTEATDDSESTEPTPASEKAS